ncbi:MAG TPA: heme d1 biosynthesis radical SAM protein NirJ [Thermopetrobacter sp.]|nr:heme d1 biosynthesis radical SAM protein NirJ [Thermopetrobacter sp.]
MQALVAEETADAPSPERPARAPLPADASAGRTGPVVIWNLIRRCNLLCKHCYAISGNVDFPGELSFGEVCTVMDDLKAYGVPVLILSGGEPLLRPDIFDISRRAKEMGFYVGLSTNGVLISEPVMEELAAVGYDYVGISLDGIGAVHDAFRGMKGAFEKSLNALRLCRDHGIKAGVRFTMTEDNAHQFEDMLALVREEGIEKFYFSHLVYAGRGNKNRMDDAAREKTRATMERLFELALEDARSGSGREYVTGNNDADGVFLLLWVQRHFPERAEKMRALLARWGGNQSGVNVANIDNVGDVHPDTMWWHYTLGNVRERPFSEIWEDVSDPLMAGLKQSPRPVKGRCAECQYLTICNGNTRVRAQQLTGDAWAEDPACYLTNEEIGVAPREREVHLTPFRGRRATTRA